jgi:preprotein translocase subunit SecA
MSNTAVDSSFLENLWERVTDSFSSISENVGALLTRVFGSGNERYIRRLGYLRATSKDVQHTVVPGSLLAQVNALEDQMKALSDEELRGLTPKFRQRLANGETLEDLLPEAFAACREAGWRTKKMRHFDVQILGGIVLHQGKIAEMVTGEGKTLVATLPAFLNALEGKGVHIITVNDYLARRDCEWMLPIYRALGLTAGYIQSDMDSVDRRAAYDCDITYGTNSEFGFDYLRDNMKPACWGDPRYDPFYQQCQKNLHYAIIDEVDNILIDEARTPLIISGPAFGDPRRYTEADRIARELSELQNREPGRYFEIKEKEHTCHLTDEGVRKAEELAGVESFYTAGNMEWPHLIDNALKAHHLYKKDKRYAVMRHPETGEMSVIIIDEFTGRLMLGRQWSDGLHQAVEAKHIRDGVKIKEETQTLATITLQNFFKLYRKLSGMTGTAMTESDEFWKIYNLEVIAVPTNKPLIRINSPDVIYRTEKEKWRAVVEEVMEVHRTGRPILLGTTDVDKSVTLSELLKRRGIKHELLNALPEHAAREAEIVAQAGRIGAVTIATNMAGRGTDIILGGNPETLAWAQLKHKYPTRLDVPDEEWNGTVSKIASEVREVSSIGWKGNMTEEGRKIAEMGGVHIIGTERHEARRIDNQLRGRAGRQGDPGSSRFFLSLQDDLMRIFAGEWVSNILTRLGMEEGQAIESRMVSRRISSAQKKVEERNFDSRKHLLEYDEVMDFQRKQTYGYRQRILDGSNCKIEILEMIDHQIERAVARFLDPAYGAATFAEFAARQLSVEFAPYDFHRCTYEEAEQIALDRALRMVESQVYDSMEENLGSEDASEWNWQAFSHQVNARWGLKTTDRQLKQAGKDNLAAMLIEQGHKAVNKINLDEGKPYLEPTWGLRSLCDWAHHKFDVSLAVENLQNQEEVEVRRALRHKVLDLYREKDIQFPVTQAILSFMSDRRMHAPGGQRYNREGLYQWAQIRFPQALDRLNEDEFRTQPRSKLAEKLLEISRSLYPAKNQEQIDDKLADVFEGSNRSADEEDAQELSTWMQEEFGLEVPSPTLVGCPAAQVRSRLWNAYDEAFRPEMNRMERSLLLNQLDSSWKNHLYQMDFLRSTIGLRGYAQEDPKVVYKEEGMKEFRAMWEAMEDRATNLIFRMEETDAFQDSLWVIENTIHEAAPKTLGSGDVDQALTNQGETKKTEPIRNKGQRVGRNEPCPCGSGKKYKNCHMRQTA